VNHQQRHSRSCGRRDFLKRSGSAWAGAALASAIGTRSYAGESHTIKVALVGCGGRGSGAAANALSTKGPVKLWAVADVFQNRAEASLKNLLKQFPKQIDVPPERRFLGLDGYQKAIDALEGSDLLFAAIRENRPYNESQRCAYAAMTGILGRMAAESGKVITWDEAFASTLELAPGLEHYTLDSTPPVMPDANGRYPVAMPGTTRVL